MKYSLTKFRASSLGLTIGIASLLSSQAFAHMPWLATDADGKAVLWFGESPADKTYNMPEAISQIKITSTDSVDAIAMSAVDQDDLVGLRSTEKVGANEELVASVTYGLYHGTKLTYYVEHLPQHDMQAWPTKPRTDTTYQTIVTPSTAGGVTVVALHDGKPLKKAQVKLFCEQGHEEASEETDMTGMVTFAAKNVEPGLNAVMIMVNDKDANGELNGKAYTSTTDIITATFFVPGEHDHDEVKVDSNMPKVDPNSGALIAPSGLPNLPEELTSFGAAIAGEKIYVYGGHTGNAHSYSTQEQSDRFWCLDMSKGTDLAWKQLGTGPSLQGLALVAHGDQIIRIGGFMAMNAMGQEHDLQSQISVASYDPATNEWTSLADLPEPRSSLDAAVLGDTIYVFGGWNLSGESDASSWHQTAWSLDLSNLKSQWQAIAQPPFERRAISVAAYDGRLYVIGGMQADGGPTTRVDLYDPKSNTWSLGHALPGSGMSGFGTAAFATGDQLFVTTMDGFVHQLNKAGDSWSTIAKESSPRFFHRMLPINDHELVLIGGANMEIGKFTNIDTIRVR